MVRMSKKVKHMFRNEKKVKKINAEKNPLHTVEHSSHIPTP